MAEHVPGGRTCLERGLATGEDVDDERRNLSLFPGLQPRMTGFGRHPLPKRDPKPLLLCAGGWAFRLLGEASRVQRMRRLVSRTRRYARSETGLTLIELMVVVTIIGILSATAMAAYGAYRNRGYEAVAMSYLRNWLPAQEAHFQAYGYYADADEQLEMPLNVLRVPRDVPYNFSIDSPNRARSGWFGRARPTETGLRHFYIDETGRLLSSLSGPVRP
jgi:prepilin-type N-terminal cleavage/methylation domain-containing protein